MGIVSSGAAARACWRTLLSGFGAIAFLTLSSLSPAGAQDRIALVIGNGSYAHAPRIPTLTNPTNDAADIAATLERMGFAVISGINLDKRAMETRIRQFSDKLKQGTARIALFYYAGHGMQINDKNYLLPTDAQVNDVAQLELDVIKLDTVLQQMENFDRTNLVFLDACRNNPFAAELTRSAAARSIKILPSGLANVDGGAGLFISFAAGPNKEALDGKGQRNSPFTSALLKHLATPGLNLLNIQTRVVDQVFVATNRFQVPWSHSSLRNDVILVAAPPPSQVGGAQLPEGPPKSSVVTRPDYAAECDEEAGYRYDPDRPASNKYRAFRHIDAAKALRVCGLARDNSSSTVEERRMRLLFGRALAARGRDEAQRGDHTAAHSTYAQAVSEWQRAAAMNSGHAYNVLAAYLQGEFTENETPAGRFVPATPDYNEAFRNYRRAADLGNPNGLVNAGVALIGLDNRFRDQIDERKARIYLERGRQIGFPRAYYAIGHSMILGLGYEKNEREGLRHIGVAYCKGENQAKKFFAENSGYAQPQCRGDVYVDPVATSAAAAKPAATPTNPAGDRCDQLAANPTDRRKPVAIEGAAYATLREQSEDAIRFCEQAVKRAPGELRYRYQLGRALQFKDRGRAFDIHRDLAQRGYAAAFDNLGWIYFSDRNNPPEAVRQFIAGSRAGDPDAMVSLGEMIGRGHYSPPNPVDAKLFLFRRAAELGHPNGARAYELELSLMSDGQARFSDKTRLQRQVSQFFQSVLGVKIQ